MVTFRYSTYSSNKRLIPSKNRLKFDVLVDTEREFLTLQLEDLLTPKKIETTDSKIHNFSILTTGKMNTKVTEQINIEGISKIWTIN